MSRPTKVLLIDDQPGEILWLVDHIHHRGYQAEIATNEGAARLQLKAVADGSESYALAIVDVMVAIMTIEELIATGDELDESFFHKSTSTGIRLCRYARQELRLTESALPMACLTMRSEESEVNEAMTKLHIPVFPRVAPEMEEHPILEYLDLKLPKHPSGRRL